MKKFYIVLYTHSIFEPKVFLFDDFFLAWNKAVGMANASALNAHYLINENPPQVKNSDGQAEWKFLNSNVRDVRLIEIDYEEKAVGPIGSDARIIHTSSTGSAPNIFNTLSFRDGYAAPASFIGASGCTGPCGPCAAIGATGSYMDGTPIPPYKAPPMDDPFADNLPAGWNLGNQPITIAQLKAYPADIKDMLDLNDEQLWALVIARIQKRVNYKCHIPLFGRTGNKYSPLREEVLVNLKLRNAFAFNVRDFELEQLENFINTL